MEEQAPVKEIIIIKEHGREALMMPTPELISREPGPTMIQTTTPKQVSPVVPLPGFRALRHQPAEAIRTQQAEVREVSGLYQIRTDLRVLTEAPMSGRQPHTDQVRLLPVQGVTIPDQPVHRVVFLPVQEVLVQKAQVPAAQVPAESGSRL